MARDSTPGMAPPQKILILRGEHAVRTDERPVGRTRGACVTAMAMGMGRQVTPVADAVRARRVHARKCRAVELGGYLHGKQPTHYRGPSAHRAIVRMDHAR